MESCDIRHALKRTDEGYVLAGVIILLAIFMLMLAAALPKIREEIRRDQELETMHRGQQYVRAVQLYYRRFHRFPPDVTALQETNGVHFLRQKYSDPLTGKDDWTPIGLGQNRAPLTMGFFGEVVSLGAAPPPNSAAAATSGILGKPPDTAFSQYSSNGGSSAPGSSATALPGGMIGGAGIIGFSPAGHSPSIKVYKTKNYYDEWEFVYDPTTDRNLRGLVPTYYQPPPNVGAPGFGPVSPVAHRP